MNQPPSPILDYANGRAEAPALAVLPVGPNVCLRRLPPSAGRFAIAVVAWMSVTAVGGVLAAGGVMAALRATPGVTLQDEAFALAIVVLLVLFAPVASLGIQLHKRSRVTVMATLTPGELIVDHLWGGITRIRRGDILRVELAAAGLSLTGNRRGVIRVHLSDGRCVRLFALTPWSDIASATATLGQAMGFTPAASAPQG